MTVKAIPVVIEAHIPAPHLPHARHLGKRDPDACPQRLVLRLEAGASDSGTGTDSSVATARNERRPTTASEMSRTLITRQLKFAVGFPGAGYTVLELLSLKVARDIARDISRSVGFPLVETE